MPDPINQQDIIDELAVLRAEVVRLRERPVRWRRLGVLGSVLALVAVALVGSAGAAPTTDTTAVAFVSIPPKTVMNVNTINPGATESAVVIGGTTTVPSNATTVRLEVTVKGTAAGTITLFPAGNEAGGADHTVSWAAGGTTTETEAENVGLSNKVSVKNSSTKAAVVTLKITGYSTQVTAGDINSSGGSDGQVLTNNGTGGVEWRTPQPAHTVRNFNGTIVDSSLLQTAAQLTLPAGSYQVSGTWFSQSNSSSLAVSYCRLASPAGATIGTDTYSSSANFDSYTPGSAQGLVTTTGGTVKLQCRKYFGADAVVYYPSLTAVRVGSVTGSFTSARTRADSPAKTLPPHRQR